MFLEKHDQRVDVLFLGSSRVRRGVIPIVFDSITKVQTKREGISFNLGGPAATVGENIYLLKNYSKSHQGQHLNTAVIEWIDDYLPKSNNYKTERARYWMDDESFIQQMRLLNGSPGMMASIMDGRFSYVTSAYLLRSIGLRRISSAWMDTLTPDLMLSTNRGYARLKNRHAPLINSGPFVPGKPVYDPLQALRDRDTAFILHRSSKLKPLREDLDLWLVQVRKYKDRGIRLMLLIPPGPVTARQLALARKLPKENVLDLSDPIQYPDLYDPEIYYDFVHLNHEGAERFTRHLAAAILQRQTGDRKR